MSHRPPWIKPAISFGVPLLALVIGLPYLTGHGYGLPASGDLARTFSEARRSVASVVGGDAATRPGQTVRLYECTTTAGKLLSDKPCGRGARVHDIDPNAVSHFEPPKPAPAAGGGPRTGPDAILRDVRDDLEAAKAVDQGHRALAEADAQ
jgi:hypothetical protein